MPSHGHSCVKHSNFSEPPRHFIELPIASAAVILSKHLVKIVKALRDNLCEATELVTTRALRDMKLGSCNLQREPFSPLEARWPADPPNKPQQFAKPLFFTGGCHQREEAENCKLVKVLIILSVWWPGWGGNNHQKGCLTVESSLLQFFFLKYQKSLFFSLSSFSLLLQGIRLGRRLSHWNVKLKCPWSCGISVKPEEIHSWEKSKFKSMVSG